MQFISASRCKVVRTVGPWATPWLERALPEAVRLVAHAPQRAGFTRLIRVRNKAEARGVWKACYEKWECVTRDKVDPALLELVPDLTSFVPPATVIDRQTYCAFTNSRLQAFLDEHQVNTLIASGGERCLCARNGAGPGRYRLPCLPR
nr:isochorismatase family protein [Bradyrhizobium japonicum]